MDSLDIRKKITLHLAQADLGWRYCSSPADAPIGRMVKQGPNGGWMYETKSGSEDINSPGSYSKIMSGEAKKKTIKFSFEGKDYKRTTANDYKYVSIGRYTNPEDPSKIREVVSYHGDVEKASKAYHPGASSVVVLQIPSDGGAAKSFITLEGQASRGEYRGRNHKGSTLFIRSTDQKPSKEKPAKVDPFDNYDFKIQRVMYDRLNKMFPTPVGTFQMNGLPFIPLYMNSWSKVMDKVQKHYKESYLPSIGKDIDSVSDEERSSDEMYNQTMEFVRKQMKRDLKKATPEDRKAMEEWLSKNP